MQTVIATFAHDPMLCQIRTWSVGLLQAGFKAWVPVIMLVMACNLQAEVAIPALTSPVTDLTTTLSAAEKQRLLQKLAAFEQKKGSQLAILIVPSTQPETIEQYSIRVVEAWKLGRKKVDDGALLLIAKQDRTVRIEVGYGLEGALTDATAKQIIDDIIVPNFKAGQFFTGVEAGTQAMIDVLDGESLPPPRNQRSTAHATSVGNIADNLIFILVGFMVFGRILQSALGRLAGAGVTSVGVGVIGWVLFSSIAIAIGLAVLALFFGLFQHPGHGIYRGSRHSGYDDHHWGGMGRGGGFGGGGGFSGGGGGFGGGGASGRW